MTTHSAVDPLARVAYYRAECHITAARFWSNAHSLIGMVAAGLAAAAGGTAFAGQTVIAGVSGILSAAVAGFLTISAPDEKSQQHWQAAQGYAELMRDLQAARNSSSDSRIGETPEGEEQPPRLVPARAATALGAASNESTSRSDFEDRYRVLERASFPVPKRLCRKAETYIAKREGWYPPLPESFEDWWNERSRDHGPWWKPWSAPRRIDRARSDVPAV